MKTNLEEEEEEDNGFLFEKDYITDIRLIFIYVDAVEHSIINIETAEHAFPENNLSVPPVLTKEQIMYYVENRRKGPIGGSDCHGKKHRVTDILLSYIDDIPLFDDDDNDNNVSNKHKIKRLDIFHDVSFPPSVLAVHSIHSIYFIFQEIPSVPNRMGRGGGGGMKDTAIRKSAMHKITHKIKETVNRNMSSSHGNVRKTKKNNIVEVVS